MNDKLFNLMEKMYLEFTGNFKQMDQRLGNLETKVETFEENTEQRFESLQQRETKLEMIIENDVLEKINALYDDRAEVKESLSSINSKIDNLAMVYENHELRIIALESGKKAI